jgi:hypothetical protein
LCAKLFGQRWCVLDLLYHQIEGIDHGVAGDADKGFKPVGMFLKCFDQRRHLDGFGKAIYGDTILQMMDVYIVVKNVIGAKIVIAMTVFTTLQNCSHRITAKHAVRALRSAICMLEE